MYALRIRRLGNKTSRNTCKIGMDFIHGPVSNDNYTLLNEQILLMSSYKIKSAKTVDLAKKGQTSIATVWILQNRNSGVGIHKRLFRGYENDINFKCTYFPTSYTP